MFASHPFQRWPHSHRRLALICVSIVALLPMLLGTVAKPLHEDEPGGESIVAFEFAGSVDRATEIKQTWQSEGVLGDAKAIQVFDMVYPLIYAAALAGLCIAAAGAWERLGRMSLKALGIALAWVAFAAAAFDYVENLGLAISLWGAPASPWPQLSAAAATLKFAAIALCVLYALSGLVALMASRRQAPRPA
jgi:hypothetical protein